ncbi:MAG TPA: 4-hydroxybenzoyl-CoA reductase subunit beta [Burkholderiales bacterium]|nr:4-hydroxybenzoyl-CoA reductase subunit beta [Burkholderiales bacterium]
MEPLPNFRLLRPRSVPEAVAARIADTHTRFLAGGTDLLANMRSGLVDTETLIDLSAIEELRHLEVGAKGLTIGAGVTLETLATDPAIVRDYAALAQAAQGVAGPTHRIVATLGGNLCLDTRCRFYNQSESWRAGNSFCLKHGGDICRVALKADRCYAAFSGDLAPALMVLGAVADIAGAQGKRVLPLSDIYTDDGKACLMLAPEDLLVGVRLPSPDGWRSAYDKVRIRGAIDFPLTGVAVALRREGRRIAKLRIATTATESQPILIQGLEALEGNTLEEMVSRLEKIVRKQLGMMETYLTSAAYRRRATLVITKRLIQRLLME